MTLTLQLQLLITQARLQQMRQLATKSAIQLPAQYKLSKPPAIRPTCLG